MTVIQHRMKIEIYYDGRMVDSISNTLRLEYEERVEMQLIEALEPFDKDLSRFDYTINVFFSEDYHSLSIYMEGLPNKLTRMTEFAIAKVRNEKPVFADLE